MISCVLVQNALLDDDFRHFGSFMCISGIFARLLTILRVFGVFMTKLAPFE